ncbi:MAG TPA: lysophospholipid acyltransferase family protein [Longimicrobium sp.]|nr:lysophospholipid acyltransferase family protein [Longimicrobium sp.]
MRSRFSPVALAAFEAFFRPWMRRRLNAVRITGLPRAPRADVPLVLAANHVSWWDTFTLREVHRILRPRAPLYTLASEAELKHLPYFRLTGAFGVDPASRASVLAAVRFLRDRVRERRDSTLIFFPQGRIWPSHRRPLGFHRGIETFLRPIAPCLVLPIAIHHEPGAASAPTVYVSCGAPMYVTRDLDHELLEAVVESESDGILDFLSLHGEEAARHWPAPHGRLDVRAPGFPSPRPVPAR